MSDSERYLKGHDTTGDINVPQLDLGGNYISYKQGPASPDNEGVEGWIKMSPSGLYFYSDGRWRKTPAYTLHWDELSEEVRFLPVNRDIELTETERLRLRDAIDIQAATQTVPGLIKGSSRTAVYGAINIQADSSAFVLPASATSAGVVRTTENATDGLAPIVATKSYVDTRVTQQGQYIPVATMTTVGGIRGGRDIQDISDSGQVLINRANFNTGSTPSMGLVRIAPPEFTLSPASTVYDDDAQTDYPYTVTVSQAKAIADYYATNRAVIDRDEYAATSNTLGFVKCKPNDGTVTIENGEISVPYATEPGQRGVVTIYSTSSALDQDETVPTMGQVVDYVAEQTSDLVHSNRTASTSLLGLVRIKAGDALQVSGSVPGEIGVRSAGVGIPGVVNIAGTGLSDYPANAVFNASTVSALLDDVKAQDATDTVSGLVKVSLTGGESPAYPPYTVPSIKKMEQYVAQQVGSIDVTTQVLNLLSDVSAEKELNNVEFGRIVGRPTLTAALPEVLRDNCIVTYGEVLGMISGGGLPDLPDWLWLAYRSEDKELELRANTFLISHIPDSGVTGVNAVVLGDLTVSLDVNIGGALLCNSFQPSSIATSSVTVNGPVTAYSFIGDISDEPGSNYFSIGTVEEPKILQIQQRDEDLGGADDNLVKVSGNLSVEGPHLTAYGIAPMSDRSSFKVYGDIEFDDRNVLGYGMHNVEEIWSKKLYGGYIQAASLATRATSPFVTKPSSLQASTYYTIDITVTFPGGSTISVLEATPVTGSRAMQRVEDIINNSTQLNQYLIAKWDSDALKVTAFKAGTAFNNTLILVEFTQEGSSTVTVSLSTSLVGAVDTGVIPDAGVDDLLAVGGSGVFSGIVKASGFESDGQLLVGDSVEFAGLLLLTTQDVDVDDGGALYTIKQPLFTQTVGDDISVSDGLPVLSAFSKFLVVGQQISTSESSLRQAFGQDGLSLVFLDYSTGNMMILRFTNPVGPKVQQGVYISPQLRIENVIKQLHNVAMAVIPC